MYLRRVLENYFKRIEFIVNYPTLMRRCVEGSSTQIMKIN